MSPKLLKRLLVVCLVLGALWVFFLYRQVPRSTTPFAKALATVERIQLTQGNQSLYLHKEKTGWTVAADPKGPSYAVDEDHWQTLRSGLEDLQLEDVISERKESAADFRVDTSGTHVILSDAQGKTLADGIVGKQAEDGTHIYFRFAGDAKVYIARGLFLGELGGMELTPWRNHKLTHIAEDKITSFQIQSKDQHLTVQKTSAAWTVNGAPANAAKVSTWLGAAAHLQADDFVASGSTPTLADLHDATISIHASDAITTLQIGAHDAKNKRTPVSSSVTPDVAWISDTRMQALLVKPNDFQ